MSASDCKSALEACGGNNAKMEGVFKKWINEHIKPGGAFYWSDNDHTEIFGCITNDTVRQTIIEIWADHVLKCRGNLAIGDVAAMCALTSNETLKEKICIACAPCCPDGDRSSIIEQFKNSILARNVANLAFNTRKKKSDDLGISDDEENGGGEENYDGPPPPGMFGGSGSGPPGGMPGFGGGGMPGFGGGGMPGFGGGGMPGFGGGGMPGFGGGGMPGFGGGMPGMNPMGENASDGFFGGDDNNDDEFGDDD